MLSLTANLTMPPKTTRPMINWEQLLDHHRFILLMVLITMMTMISLTILYHWYQTIQPEVGMLFRMLAQQDE